MATASGWDVLILSVEVTDAGWHVRVGVGFVLWATSVAYWLLSGDEDDPTKATG